MRNMDDPRPNIVLILADDMGVSDLGCYGSEIVTPNLDRLANNGGRFTQMYNSARCCPSRASLLTGVHPDQAGIGHMTNNVGTPRYQGHLNNNCATVAEVLNSAGYQTFMSGKWHVGGHRCQTARGRRPTVSRSHRLSAGSTASMGCSPVAARISIRLT